MTPYGERGRTPGETPLPLASAGGATTLGRKMLFALIGAFVLAAVLMDLAGNGRMMHGR